MSIRSPASQDRFPFECPFNCLTEGLLPKSFGSVHTLLKHLDDFHHGQYESATIITPKGCKFSPPFENEGILYIKILNY